MNKERLLNVAKACRETKYLFTMDYHVHQCGTPACAFGNYAARTDLQDAFKLVDLEYFKSNNLYNTIQAFQGVETVDGMHVCYQDEIVREHFGISCTQAEQLFSSLGCGEANTAVEAAEFIEKFVERYGE